MDPKKPIWKDEIEKQWLLSAMRAKAGNVQQWHRRAEASFSILTDLAGPVWQTDVSGTGCPQIWGFSAPPPAGSSFQRFCESSGRFVQQYLTP